MAKKINTKYQGGYIAGNPESHYITEEFKGESTDEPVDFPKGLGAKHPFNFQDIDKLIKNHGPSNEFVNKIACDVITDFEVKFQNKNAQALIDSFLKDTNAHLVFEAWTKEALAKGNGFIEVDFDNSKMRVMNANSMYVKRNKKGKVLAYNQWNKPFKSFSKDSKDLITWEGKEADKIAHLIINKIPNEAYGYGILYPNQRVVDNSVQNEQDLQTTITRKATSPYHFKVGQPGANTPQAIVDSISNKLTYLNNRTEWVTDGDVEIKVVEFNDAGKNLTDVNNYWFKQFIYGTPMPEVLHGSGQLNEGIAKVQLEDYKRRIARYQTLVASIIEEKIIRPLLKANDLDEAPEFIWELPTEEDINLRLDKLTLLIANPAIDPMLKGEMNREIAKLLGFEDLVDKLPTPEEAAEQAEQRRQEELGMQNKQFPNQQNPRDRANQKERDTEENIQQPEVPGAKPRANEKVTITSVSKPYQEVNITEGVTTDMKLSEFVNIKEIVGFNYTDYLIKILEVLRSDPFTNLKAITEKDIADGLLPEKEVEKLRIVLKDGFKENKTVREIESEITSQVEIKDRITENGTVISSAARPNIIARTETVRLANEGLKKLYKENDIVKVRWLAALSDRTCPLCEELNGQVFEISNLEVGVNQPPLHTNCRCSLLSVVG